MRVAVLLELTERIAAPEGTEVTRKDGRTYRKTNGKWVYQARRRAASSPTASPAPVTAPEVRQPEAATAKKAVKKETVIGEAAAQKMFLKYMGGRANAKEALAKVNRDLGVLLGGAHGLHTLLNTFSAPGAGVHPQIHSVETSYHRVRMRLTLHDEKGRQIGHTEREITRDEDGGLHVHQEALFLKTSSGGNSTGKGLGSKVLASNLDGYEKMGIKSATVHAAYVGSYVWAKMGYSASPEEMEKVGGAFQKYLEGQGVKAAGPFTSVKQIAEFAAGDAKHGKDFLLKLGEDGGISGWHGQGWHGELKIDRADPGYQAMNHYLGRA